MARAARYYSVKHEDGTVGVLQASAPETEISKMIHAMETTGAKVAEITRTEATKVTSPRPKGQAASFGAL